LKGPGFCYIWDFPMEDSRKWQQQTLENMSLLLSQRFMPPYRMQTIIASK
jgi:hypothetical protein